MIVRAVEYVWHSILYNFDTLQNNLLGEIAGSLGDLGTLLPIMVALTSIKAISLSATLVFSGIFNIVSGTIFGIPIVVSTPLATAFIGQADGFNRCNR